MSNATPAVQGIPERSDLSVDSTWDLTPLYPDDEAWEAEFAGLDEALEPLERMRGTLDSPARTAELFAGQTELERVLYKLYTYAHLIADTDTADSASQARQARIRSKLAELAGRMAWVRPELLEKPEDQLAEWTACPDLADFHYAMVKLLRRKPHTLSAAEETLLTRASDILSAPGQLFSFLSNADMTFPNVRDAEGAEHELSQGRYLKYLLDPDRDVRHQAFDSIHETYCGVRNTLACNLSTHVKTRNFLASTRSYDSALAAALSGNNIPVALYDSLIAAAHTNLPAFYRYIELRKNVLKLDDLNMWDMYVPMVPDCDVHIPFEEATELVLAACEPLGEAYCQTLRTAFTSRWIDVYENRGKRSGAYSSGCYDSPPYLLLNYQGTLNDVFTLAHELGHSMHSWLANHAQPPQTASYPIFIAEIASTANEALLLRHLLATRPDPQFRAYLLNHYCDSFRGTVYRQTMFAEFEKMVHELDARGTPLTADVLGEAYYELNKIYYGDGIEADRKIDAEWSRIPHFYYSFYVYKYATSFCASQIFVDRITASQHQRDQYLDLLKAGGSADPLELVRDAGVDLTEPETFKAAFDTFDRTVAELAESLNSEN